MTTRSTKIKKGGYVRITKNGSYEGEYPNAKYKIGEIWKTIKTIGDGVWDIEKDGIETRVSMDPESSYGQEAEWVGMKKPQPGPITEYQIY